jgi:hypothetical protein
MGDIGALSLVLGSVAGRFMGDGYELLLSTEYLVHGPTLEAK